MAHPPPRVPQAMSETIFKMRLDSESAQRNGLGAVQYIEAKLKNVHSEWNIDFEQARNPQSETFGTIFVKYNRLRIHIDLNYKDSEFSVTVDCLSLRKTSFRAIAGILTLGTFILSIIYVPHDASILLCVFLFAAAFGCEAMLWMLDTRAKSERELKEMFSQLQGELAEILTKS
jgi:hypothetical protein